MDRPTLTSYVPRLLLEWEPRPSGPEHRTVEGSMAFVDISGFTAMSEKLARLGKEGAEEVTDIIGSIFSRLLGVAYENGGSLLKFGGDALLLFFTGDAHELRAAHAAAGMRRGLREIGRSRTSVGIAGLRMHVGIHSGAFDLFLVGDVFLDLVIAGPHATRTVLMESAAVAGEIAVSAATADALPESVLGDERSGGRLLVRTPRPPLVPAAISIPDDVDASPFVPPRMRPVLAGPLDPEHRRVGVAFVRFEGFDDLTRRDPHRALEQIHELMCVVQAACENHGATYIDNDPERDGGKFLVVTGAPFTSERDGEALVRAAREIVDARPPGNVRVGVNLGATFAGPIGPTYRRKYTVMGDTVNLAARLMAHAAPAQVIVMPHALERSRASFDTTPLEPFAVKGKRDLIHALEVGGLRRLETVTSRTPLIGRRAEVERLRAALDATRTGVGGLVEIVGEPGLGKSRLAEEVRSIAEGFTLLHGIAEEYEHSTPYALARRVLRRALAIDDDASMEAAGESLVRTLEEVALRLMPWSPLIAVAADATVAPTPEVATLSEEFKGERLRSAVVALLGAILTGPTLIEIEDAHWLDAASAELLHELAVGAAGRPWLLVITRRPGELPATADLLSEVVELGPLGERDTADIVRAVAPGLTLTQHQIAKLNERGGGNPLYLQELALAMQAGEGLDGLPGTIDAVIGSRIDHLSYPERRVLRRAAVLGGAFSTELLEALADPGTDPDVGALRSLPDFVLEEAPGEWRFRHALIREVAYEALPYRRRAELHRRAGIAIEERAVEAVDDWADALCFHYYRAKDFPLAWRYAVIAARRALDKFAVAEAAEYYRLALDAGKRVPTVGPADLSEVAEALGDAQERLGSYTDAMHAYRTARTMRAGVADPRPPLFLKEGILRLRLGRYPQALRWYRRGIEPATPPASPDGVELGLAYAGVRYYQGRYRECIQWCERMAEAARGIGDKAGLAHAYSLLYLAHTHLGSEERSRYRDLALPLYEEIGDLTGQANVLNNLGIDAYYEGEWDRALSLYRRSRDVQDRTGNVVFVADTDNNVAEILSDQGRLEEAKELFERSLETYRASRYAMGEAFAVGNLGRVAARAGRYDDSRRLLEEALSLQRSIGDERQTAEVLTRIAELDVLEGRSSDALYRIEPTLNAVERLGDMPTSRATLLRLQAYALAQLGKLTDARSAIERSLEVARSADASYEVALSLEASAAIFAASDDPASADVAAEQASALFERLGVVATPTVPISPSEDVPRGSGGSAPTRTA